MPQESPSPIDKQPKIDIEPALLDPDFTKDVTVPDPREFTDFQADHRAERMRIMGKPLSEMGTPDIPIPEKRMLTREQLDSLDGKDSETQKRMIARYKRQNLDGAS